MNERTMEPKTTGVFGLLWGNGPACVLLAVTSHSVMNMFIKLVSDDFTISQTLMFRASFVLLFVTALGKLQKAKDMFGWSRKGPVLLRGVLGSAAIIGYTASLYFISWGDAEALYQMNLLFTILISAISGLEPVNWIMAIGAAACLSGEYLISQPPFLFNFERVWDRHMIMGTCMVLFGALCCSGSFMTVGFVGTNVHPYAMVLWPQVMVVVLNFPMFVWDYYTNKAGDITLKNSMIFSVVAIGAVGRQVFLMRGLQLSQAVVSSVLISLSVLIAYILGFFILNEKLTFLAGIGAMCVVLGVVITAHGKSKIKREGYEPLADSTISDEESSPVQETS